MARARLTRIEIQNFKSYRERASLEVAPLTVLLGKNNSGKSSLIQALLLLQQTLAHPRADIPLHLEGVVDALDLRELTSGWPDGTSFAGPLIVLEWESDVGIERALERAGWPERANLAKLSGIHWMADARGTVRLRTLMSIRYKSFQRQISLVDTVLASRCVEGDTPNPVLSVSWGTNDSQPRVIWRTQTAKKISAELDHFLPYLSINRSEVGPRHKERSWFNGYLVLYEQPLEDLRALLQQFTYLGSMREPPPSVYRPASAPPEQLGVSGEYAAQLLHARRSDVVHYLPPLRVHDDTIEIPDTVRAKPLVEAVNDILDELGVHTSLRIEDIERIGFRLLFGQASLQHVGRGLGYLLPVVQLGLISDPYRFDTTVGESAIDGYQDNLDRFTHVAIEEPETHLHPKVQSRLAHWLVALAMSGRRLIVETHSDHLVRRLRGLIARAKPGSEIEDWLARNVVIAEVEQSDAGESTLTCSRLTRQGGITERWPRDFMDEASEEERAIYYASMDKEERPADEDDQWDNTEVIHDPPSDD